LAVAQRAHLVPRRLGLPERIPLRQAPLRVSGEDVYLFTGCVMDAWQRDVHRSAQSVLELAGFGVTPTGDAAPCCGALHLHSGLAGAARALATGTIRGLRGDRPVLVDSAGCGAALKEYGSLLGTDDAQSFSIRVFDIVEFLAANIERIPSVPPLKMRVAVQDPCHLRHVQRVHLATRTVLAPLVDELVELDDDGLCCGAGGAYSILQPGLAAKARQRKLEAIARAGADAVVSSNPGCMLHLAAGGVRAIHPVELLRMALEGNRIDGACY
jgi:glycolate oxidase iron-sulfur subunit